jgi:hypothetical protein
LSFCVTLFSKLKINYNFSNMTLFSYIGLTAQLCIILMYFFFLSKKANIILIFLNRLIYIQFSLVEIEQDYKPLNMIKLDPKTITVGIIGYTGTFINFKKLI